MANRKTKVIYNIPKPLGKYLYSIGKLQIQKTLNY